MANDSALALLLGGAIVAAAQGLARPGEASSQAPRSGNQANDATAARTAYTYTTVITVTGDPDDSSSSTCCTGSGSDESPCTLRRALVEAGGLSAGERDVAATCTPTSVYRRDTEVKRVSVRFCHLTGFGLFGGEAGYEVYLPLIIKD